MLLKNSLLTLLLLSLTLLWSCDFLGGDDPEPEEPNTELEKLPPATQTGENTFGCLVNGQAWIPKGCVGSGAGADLFWPHFFTLGAQWECTDEVMRLSIGTPEGTQVTTTSYPIVPTVAEDTMNHRGGGAFTNKNNLSCKYENWHVTGGTITLTKLDKTNKIASGTFEFTTWREGCDTIRVTDGRFDFQYIN